MTTPGHNRLAECVRGASAAMLAASREAAERALEAGRLLIEAKGECRHGEVSGKMVGVRLLGISKPLTYS